MSTIELLSAQSSRIVAVDFSRTGELGFVAADTGAVLLFRPREPAVSPQSLATDRIDAASISPDGRWMVLGHATPSIGVWQTLPTPQQRATLQLAQPIRHLRFGPDSERFFAVTDRSVRVFELPDGETEYAIAERSPITYARFAPGAAQFEIIVGNRSFGVYLTEQNTITRQVTAEFELPIKHSTITARGGFWAVADDQGLVRFGRVGVTGNKELDASKLAPLAAMASDHNGQHLALVGRTGQAWIVDLSKDIPNCLACSLIPATQWLAFSSDKRSLLAVSQDHAAFLRLDVPSPLARITPINAPVAVAESTEDGGIFFLGQANGSLAKLDIATGELEDDPLLVHLVPDKLVVDHSGSRVAVISERYARVWDTIHRVPASPLLEHDSAILAATFCHGGRFLATTAADHGLRVWDISTGNLVSYWQRSSGTPLACHFDEAKQEWQIIFSDGIYRATSLHSDLRPIEELRQEAERITGLHIDRMGSLVAKP